MTKETKITITIDEHGRIVADAEGFQGPICMKEMEKLLEGLPEIDKSDRKPDYFKKEIQTRSNVQVKY